MLQQQECLLELDSSQATSGTFLLSSALRHNCALDDSPLRIEAKSGQQINITMIDATVSGAATPATARDESACPVRVGQISDTAGSHALPICGSKQRVSHLVLSNANKLSLHVHRGLASTDFIFQYTGERARAPRPRQHRLHLPVHR